MQLLARGRVAQWSREKIDTLSTPELRQLRLNAQRLKETQIAALCDELLGARARSHAVARKRKSEPEATGPATRSPETE